jgi:hypothetical protein
MTFPVTSRGEPVGLHALKVHRLPHELLPPLNSIIARASSIARADLRTRPFGGRITGRRADRNRQRKLPVLTTWHGRAYGQSSMLFAFLPESEGQALARYVAPSADGMPISRLPAAALRDEALSAPLRRALGVLLHCGRAAPTDQDRGIRSHTSAHNASAQRSRCRALRLSMFWRDPYFHHSTNGQACRPSSRLPESLNLMKRP